MNSEANHSLKFDLQLFGEGDLAPSNGGGDPAPGSPEPGASVIPAGEPGSLEPGGSPGEAEPVPGGEPTPPGLAQPQTFKVKYNHQEIEVPLDEATTLIQKGMNYDKVAQQAQQEVLQRVSPVLGFIEKEAARHGLDPVTYIRAVEANRERSYYDNLSKQAEELGVDPKVFAKIVENHPEVQRARQKEQEFQGREQQMTAQQRFQQEGQELFQMFPNLDVKDIPQEVFSLRAQTGISLVDAYLRVSHKPMIDKARIDGEQAAVKALKNNANSSPGALGGEGAEQKSGYAALSKADKKALRERVLRGENVQL